MVDKTLMNVTQVNPATGNYVRYFRTKGAANRFSSKLLGSGVPSCSVGPTPYSFCVCWRKEGQ